MRFAKYRLIGIANLALVCTGRHEGTEQVDYGEDGKQPQEDRADGLDRCFAYGRTSGEGGDQDNADIRQDKGEDKGLKCALYTLHLFLPGGRRPLTIEKN